MLKFLVTGASGQLGQEFRQLAMDSSNIESVFWARKDGDITQQESLLKINDIQPDVVINCAAYTAVDLAESHLEEAKLTNATAVRNLAIICEDLNIPVIHFSSDYVYNNDLNRPLKETDPVNPQGVYARTKLEGEQYLLENHGAALVFRVSWLYSTFGHNFPKTILRLCKNREELNVVEDQIGAPTYARDLATAIWTIIQKYPTYDHIKRYKGIYNYSNEGLTNWAEIAESVVDFAGYDCRINRIPSIEFPTAAPRPVYSKLNLSKFKETFGQQVEKWDVSLAHCLAALKIEQESE